MSPILELLIGMIFLYSLLSVLVTQMNTISSDILNLRAKNLRKGLEALIFDSRTLAELMTHPLIRLLRDSELKELDIVGDDVTEEDLQEVIQSELAEISYIYPQSFVQALTSIIRVEQDRDLYAALHTSINRMPAGEVKNRLRQQVNSVVQTGEGTGELRAMIDRIKHPVYRDALKKMLAEIDEEIQQPGIKTDNLVALMAGINTMDNVYMRRSLQSILSASKDLQEAEKRIEGWFNEGMKRSSEFFQSSMKVLSIFFGLTIAIVLNVDSVYIAQEIWANPTLRSSIAQVASNTDLTELQSMLDEANAEQQDDDDTLEDVGESVQAASATLQRLLDLDLPIGWTFNPQLDAGGIDPQVNLASLLPGVNPNWLSALIIKIIGILVTTVAIAQGAPFWFGLLRRLSNR